MIKICLNCNKKFNTKSQGNKQIFCSNECYRLSKIGIKRPKETKEKISKALKGIQFSEEHKRNISKALKGRKLTKEHRKKISKNNAKFWLGKKRAFFTEKTRKKMSESLKGKKCYLWKGGITPKNEKIRKGIEFRLWREAVFARDNWTCQKCLKRSKKENFIYLHPHHIKNFSQYPELRFAIDNGITFCEKCHKLFHKKYSKYNNNEEQLKEYLINNQIKQYV